MLKNNIATATIMGAVDGAARILAVVTIDQFNQVMAAVIAVLSVIHIAIRIRKELRDK